MKQLFINVSHRLPLVLTSGVLTQSMAWCCAEGRKAWQLHIVRTRSCRSLKKEATQLKIDTTQPTQPANRPLTSLRPFSVLSLWHLNALAESSSTRSSFHLNKLEASLSQVGPLSFQWWAEQQSQGLLPGRQASRQALGPRPSAESSKLERVKYLLNVQSSCTVDFPVTHLQFLPSGIM